MLNDRCAHLTKGGGPFSYLGGSYILGYLGAEGRTALPHHVLGGGIESGGHYPLSLPCLLRYEYAGSTQLFIP